MRTPFQLRRRVPALAAATLLVGWLVSHHQRAHASLTYGAAVHSLVAAHRGGYFGAQNVLRQFRATMAAGASDILEMDLHATRDGVVLVYHDPTLDSKTQCHGSIEDRDYAALRHCRLPEGDPLARFGDVLDAARGKVLVDAEFKTDAVIAPAVRMAMEKGALGYTYFQTQGDRHKYRLARAISPDVRLQFKTSDEADLDWALSLHDPALVVLEMSPEFATPGHIRRIHAAGKLVSVNSWRYQMLEERLDASCDSVFARSIDIAVTNNPGKCSAQRTRPREVALRLDEVIAPRPGHHA